MPERMKMIIECTTNALAVKIVGRERLRHGESVLCQGLTPFSEEGQNEVMKVQ